MKKIILLIFLFSFSSCEWMNPAKNISRAPQSEADVPPATGHLGNAYSAEARRSISDQINTSAQNDTIDTEQHTLPDQVCLLPREAINPDYYARYCNKSCSMSGTSCLNHKDCCSQSCSQGFCQANFENLTPVNGRCNSPSDCASGRCEMSPYDSHKICYGNSRIANSCGLVEDPCVDGSNCCSGACSNARCIGSPSAPAVRGQYCAANHSECESRNCNLTTHKCE